MALHPLIRHQFRAEIGSQTILRSRMKVAVIGSIAGAIFLLLSLAYSPQSLGVKCLMIATLTALATTASAALYGGVGLMDAEREAGVLDLLFLAGVRPWQVFAGRFLGHLLVILNFAWGFIPFLVLGFAFRGVPPTAFWQLVAFIPLTVLLGSAIAAFASVLGRSDGSTLIAGLIALILGGLPLLLHYLAQLYGGHQPSLLWRALSPANIFWFCFDPANPMPAATFAVQSGSMLLYTILLAGIANWLFLRSWKPTHACAATTLSSGMESFRKRCFETNPFVWASYKAQAAGGSKSWILMLVLIGAWFAGWFAWGDVWIHPLNVLLTALILNQAVMLLALYASASKMAEDRKTGAFELLLTTPLNPEQIVTGHGIALSRQFRQLVLVCSLFNVCLLVFGAMNRSWTWISAATYILSWGIVFFFGPVRGARCCQFGQWISLNVGRTDLAMTRAGWGGANVGFWVQLWQIPHLFSGTGRRFPAGTFTELAIVGAIAVICFSIYFFDYRREVPFRKRMIDSMRAIACEPIPPPNDERLKTWDGTNPFPG